jgi:hypothetical protein
MHKSITIPTYWRHDLDVRMRRLAKLAEKFGLSPIPAIVAEGKPYDRVQTEHVSEEIESAYGHRDSRYVEARTRIIPVVDVELELPDMERLTAPGEWRVAGSLALLDNGQIEATILDPLYAEPVKAARASANLTCDHCRTKRYRVKTFVVVNAEAGASPTWGEVVQVGRECLSAYVSDWQRQVDELAFAETLSTLIPMDMEFREERFGGGPGMVHTAYSLDAIMPVVCRWIRVHGFVKSRTEANEWGESEPNANATWREVVRHIQGEPERLDESHHLFRENSIVVRAWEANEPMDIDREQAAKILSWMANLDPKDDEFLIALKEVTDAGYLSSRKVALIAAMPGAYERAMRAARPEPTTLAPDGKAVVSGVVRSEKEYSSQFGTVYKILIDLDCGNRVFVTRPAAWDGSVGERITIRATWQRKEPHFSTGSRPSLVS